jgi:hypothetical protein
MMKKLVLLTAVMSMVLSGISFADNGSGIITDLGLGEVLDYTTESGLGHNDVDDGYGFKGTFTLTVTNTGTEDWGDFHFEIIYGVGGDPANVLFLDSSMSAWDNSGIGQDPSSSSQTLDNWKITNPVDGLSTMDLYFYNDPILAGETASFVVYTDNTEDNLSFFGMAVYPTPVPEPATMSLIVLGGLLLRRRK